MPVKKKKSKKKVPVEVGNRLDLVQFMHNNHNGLLPPEAFVFLERYMKKNKMLAYHYPGFCKTFCNQYIGAWGLHLFHVFAPTQSNTKRKGGELYIPPSVAIKRSLKKFFKEEYAEARQRESNVPPVNDTKVQDGKTQTKAS